ncbi:MAG: hypothetical protein WBG95_12090 [Sulfitobacter sp.]
MTLPYTYTTRGRRPATFLTVLVVWGLIAAAYLWLEAAPMLLAFIGLFTLPALYDLAANPESRLTLNAETLSWTSGRQDAQIALSEIEHLRFDTRLDLSVRLSVVRPSGIKIRVPFPATPPHQEFEKTALEAGLKTCRHHFSLMS